MREGGRQRIRARYGSEELWRLPVKGESRDWEQGRTRSNFVEVKNGRGKPGMRNIFGFIPSDLLGNQEVTPTRCGRWLVTSKDAGKTACLCVSLQRQEVCSSSSEIEGVLNDFLLDILKNPPGGDLARKMHLTSRNAENYLCRRSSVLKLC